MRMVALLPPLLVQILKYITYMSVSRSATRIILIVLSSLVLMIPSIMLCMYMVVHPRINPYRILMKRLDISSRAIAKDSKLYLCIHVASLCSYEGIKYAAI